MEGKLQMCSTCTVQVVCRLLDARTQVVRLLADLLFAEHTNKYVSSQPSPHKLDMQHD